MICVTVRLLILHLIIMLDSKGDRALDDDSDLSEERDCGLSSTTTVTPQQPPTVNPPEASTSAIKQRKVQHRKSRPCYFCGHIETNLSRHMTTVHCNEPEIQEALKQPKSMKNAILSSLRKKGIMKYNEKLMCNKDVDPKSYHRQRASKGGGDMVVCSACKGCFSSNYFFRHKKRCSTRVGVVPQKVPLPLAVCRHRKISEDFKVEVLARFTKDRVGELCTNDDSIMNFGAKLYEKLKQNPDKAAEIKKSTMQNMRRLGHVYLQFHQQCATSNVESMPTSAKDILARRHFDCLREAIKNYTSADTDQIKAGLKHHIYYLLVKFAKYQKVVYLTEDDDSKAKEVENFMEVLNMSSKDLLGDALYKLHKNRQMTLRKPQQIPSQEDVTKVKEYTLSRVRVLSDAYSPWDAQRYAELRDLVVCRLTLFNARRGGEPARLLLSEWKDGEKGTWFDSERIEKLNDVDAKLFGQMKLTYQSGKGDKHLVPLLIPADIVKAMELLADPEVREQSDILSTNIFMFPTTHKSTFHVNGWHSVNRICRAAQVDDPSRLTATKQRHRVSTLYAGLDVEANERSAFYQHMGHSAEINANVYQAPLAESEIRLVGSHLLRMDAHGSKEDTASSDERDMPASEMEEDVEGDQDHEDAVGTESHQSQHDSDASHLCSATSQKQNGTVCVVSLPTPSHIR